MFIDLTKKQFDKLKKYIDELNIPYHVENSTIKGDLEEIIHLDFAEDLTEKQISILNKYIDTLNQKENPNRDLDGDGLPDYLQEGEKVKVKYSRHKMDDNGNPAGALKAHLTGTDTYTVEEERTV